MSWKSAKVWMIENTTTTIVTGLSSGHRSEEHTSELQSRLHLVCRLLLEKKKPQQYVHSPSNPVLPLYGTVVADFFSELCMPRAPARVNYGSLVWLLLGSAPHVRVMLHLC